MLIVLWVVLGLVGIFILWLIITYNSIITLKTRTQEAWSDISVQLKRRYDLIPNLIETVKGYAKHEREVFEKVTQARTAAMQGTTPAEKAKAENMLTDALKSIFAVAENYPDLKASNNFMQLQEELTDTEDKIQASRRFYNGNVRDFNIKIRVFPNSIWARMLGFKEFDLFEVGLEAEKEPVKVSF